MVKRDQSGAFFPTSLILIPYLLIPFFPHSSFLEVLVSASFFYINFWSLSKSPLYGTVNILVLVLLSLKFLSHIVIFILSLSNLPTFSPFSFYNLNLFSWARICKRVRSPVIDSTRLGIDSWAPLKGLQIRALWSNPLPLVVLILPQIVILVRRYSLCNPNSAILGHPSSSLICTSLPWLFFRVQRSKIVMTCLAILIYVSMVFSMESSLYAYCTLYSVHVSSSQLPLVFQSSIQSYFSHEMHYIALLVFLDTSFPSYF